MRTAYLLFSTRSVRAGVPLARWFKTARRHPRTAKYAFITWLVRALSRSPITHVAIADTDVVLDPSLAGNRLWPLDGYLMKYPRLCWMFTIHTPREMSLQTFRHGSRPRRWLPSVLRLLTRGWFPADDCVTETVKALRLAGVQVPRRVCTPAQLFDWIRGEGHGLTDLAGADLEGLAAGGSRDDPGHP